MNARDLLLALADHDPDARVVITGGREVLGVERRRDGGVVLRTNPARHDILDAAARAVCENLAGELSRTGGPADWSTWAEWCVRRLEEGLGGPAAAPSGSDGVERRTP